MRARYKALLSVSVVAAIVGPAFAFRTIQTQNATIRLLDDTGDCGAEFVLGEDSHLVDFFGSGVAIAIDAKHETIQCHGTSDPADAAELGATTSPVRFSLCTPQGAAAQGCCDYTIGMERWSVSCQLTYP
jgi:hypothetical protein